VGPKTERSLWSQGCHDWDCLLDGLDGFSIGSASKAMARNEVLRSKAALDQGVHQYFHKRLKARHTWRAWPSFRHCCVYLDIETDGGVHEDCITTIGLYDGADFRCLVRGEDLESFRDEISRYSMIVTFFGTGFDLPVLQRRFPGVVLDHIHLDLCSTFRLIGVRGGLKRIEQTFGIERSPETQGLSGYDAVQLWRSYLRGKDSDLERLIAYNREDVVNLEPLAQIAYSRLVEVTTASPSEDNS
jgi:uncharacterized protein